MIDSLLHQPVRNPCPYCSPFLHIPHAHTRGMFCLIELMTSIDVHSQTPAPSGMPNAHLVNLGWLHAVA